MRPESRQANGGFPLRTRQALISSSLGRRDFLKAATMAGGAAMLHTGGLATGQDLGTRPERDSNVRILNPCGRVPMSLIIDDSTCLVNLAHFGIPQFAEV